MATPFESPRFLLAQTRENLKEFEAICKALFDEGNHASVIEVDPQTGNKTYKIKFLSKIPGRARHIASTAISDLRHVLDQATCESIRLVTGNDPGLVYFPFATNPNDLDGRLKKNFPDEIHPIFRSFEAYPRGTGYAGGDDALASFSRIAGPNKHQFSCKIEGRITSTSVEYVKAKGLAIHVGLPPRWDANNNEMILGTVAPDATLEYNFEITFFVALADAGELSGAPVTGVINVIMKKAERIVADLSAGTAKIVASKTF